MRQSVLVTPYRAGSLESQGQGADCRLPRMPASSGVLRSDFQNHDSVVFDGCWLRRILDSSETAELRPAHHAQIREYGWQLRETFPELNFDESFEIRVHIIDSYMEEVRGGAHYRG